MRVGRCRGQGAAPALLPSLQAAARRSGRCARRVTRNEAERWEENRAEREEKARLLREQLIREFESQGLPVPEVLQQHPPRS